MGNTSANGFSGVGSWLCSRQVKASRSWVMSSRLNSIRVSIGWKYSELFDILIHFKVKGLIMNDRIISVSSMSAAWFRANVL